MVSLNIKDMILSLLYPYHTPFPVLNHTGIGIGVSFETIYWHQSSILGITVIVGNEFNKLHSCMYSQNISIFQSTWFKHKNWGTSFQNWQPKANMFNSSVLSKFLPWVLRPVLASLNYQVGPLYEWSTGTTALWNIR